MATIIEQVFAVIEKHQDVGITSAAVAVKMKRERDSIKDAFTRLVSAERITYTQHGGHGVPRVYWPAADKPKTNGAAKPDNLIGNTTHAAIVLDALRGAHDGLNMKELIKATGLDKGQVASGFRPLYHNELVAAVRGTGTGSPMRWYIAECAPKHAVLNPKRPKPPGRATPPPSDHTTPSVNSAMDAISTLAAERENYHNTLLAIKELIDNTLQGE